MKYAQGSKDNYSKRVEPDIPKKGTDWDLMFMGLAFIALIVVGYLYLAARQPL
jgi:hypothetical protein